MDRIALRTPERIHSDQVSLHILLPILLTAVICLTVGILLTVTTISQPASTVQWAHIALIFLIAPLLLFGLILLVFIIFLSKLMAHWNITLPPSLRIIRESITGFNVSVQRLSMQPARPLIFIKSLAAGVRAIIKKRT
ncbi:MAG: hypothetical protein C0401_05030 [Anaerolinea sp.]|nr:hypothetical protein [Anaerolinea sp.]